MTVFNRLPLRPICELHMDSARTQANDEPPAGQADAGNKVPINTHSAFVRRDACNNCATAVGADAEFVQEQHGMHPWTAS